MRRGCLKFLPAVMILAFASYSFGEVSKVLKDVESSSRIAKTDWGSIHFNDPSASGLNATLKIKTWPDSNEIALPTPFPNIVKAWFAADPHKHSLGWNFNADASEIRLQLPPRVKADDDSLAPLHGNTIHILTAEKTVQYADGTIVLSALDSKIDGDRAKLESHPGNHRIGFWSNREDSVNWEYNATRWGMYDVELVYSTASPTGSEISLSIGQKTLSVKLVSTGSWYQYQVIPVGRVYLEAAGKHAVKVHCVKMVGGAVMNLKALILHPTSEGKDIITPKNDKLTLHSRDATVHGVNLRYEPNPKKLTLGYWSNANDNASWQFDIKRAGKYRVEVLQGCGKGQGGSQVQVLFPKNEKVESLEFTVEDTGHFQNFVTRSIGEVELAAGVQRCEIRPLKKAQSAVMDLRQVELIPTE